MMFCPYWWFLIMLIESLKGGKVLMAPSSFRGTHSIIVVRVVVICYSHFAPEENPEYLLIF